MVRAVSSKSFRQKVSKFSHQGCTHYLEISLGILGPLALKIIFGPVLNGTPPFPLWGLREGSQAPRWCNRSHHCADVSILDQLRARMQSDLSRKRKTHELPDCFPVLYTGICFSLRIREGGYQSWEFRNRIVGNWKHNVPVAISHHYNTRTCSSTHLVIYLADGKYRSLEMLCC